MLNRFVILPVLCMVYFSGCATLFGEKDKSVRVESNPKGAKVYLNGMPFGRTPTTIQLVNMTSSNMLTVKLKGYETITRPINTTIQPVAFLNLLNIICWGIDFATGNLMKVENKFIMVDLDRVNSSAGDYSAQPYAYASRYVSPQCAYN